MKIDIIIKIVIPIIGAIVTYILVPLIKEKTTKEQREKVYFWVRMAVQSAEMIYKEKGQGKKKKDFVIDYLTGKGIDIGVRDLDILIEAAVKELNIWQGELL